MPDTDDLTADRNQRDDFLRAVASVLVVAAALILVGALFSAIGFQGVSARDRAELISGRLGDSVAAAFLLAAIATLFFGLGARAERIQPMVVAVLLIGGVIVLLNAFSILDVLTRHVSNTSDTVDIINITGAGSLAARLGGALPMAASMLIALVAMVGANRLGNLVNGSRGTSELPQDLWEDE